MCNVKNTDQKWTIEQAKDFNKKIKTGDEEKLEKKEMKRVK